MPFSITSILSGIAQASLEVLSLTWWFIIPIILGIMFWGFWKYYVSLHFIRNINWVILRVKTPKEVLKTPKAMEQIFAAAHTSYTFGIRPFDKYWKGQIETWYSFELIGDANGVYFLIRTPAAFRNTLESAIYAQYPNAEIEVVEDYLGLLPSVLPNDTYDIFGTEFILKKADAYPIRTYPYFESIEEEEKIDTIAILTEAMSRLKSGERIWLQFLIRPNDDSWKKKAEKERDRLAGRKDAKSRGLIERVAEVVVNLFQAPGRLPEWQGPPEKPEKPSIGLLTKGEQETIKGIEEKISKTGFDAVIRFIYIDEKDSFSRDNVAAVMGAFRQVNTLNMNNIAPNLDTMTLTRGAFRDVFKKRRVYYKKRKIFDSYRFLKFPRKFSIFNTEELATLYHFPSKIVGAPFLRPIEFKKGAPPSNLPTEQ